MKQKAFTLVELIIVIAVIAILAGITVVGWGNYQERMETNKVKSDLQMVVAALQNEINFKDTYPSTLPSTIKASEGIELDYIREGSEYCILATSVKDPSIRYFIRSSNSSTIQSGNCVPPPAAPVVTATALSSTSIRVSWPAANGATSYTVRYGTASPTTTIACNTSPCTISALSSSTTYRFNVTATNSSGSTTSATVTRATPAPYTCPEGGTLNGTNCTETYAASYQNGTSGYYYCPSGGSLSGTSCTTSSSYPASYQSGSSGYYYCPSGGTLSGTECSTSTTYSATGTTTYSCPYGGSLSGTTCTMPATSTTTYSCPNGGSLSGTTCTKAANRTENKYCPHSADSDYNLNNCRHDRGNYTTQAGCQSAGYTWSGGRCFEIHPKVTSGIVSCDSGWSLSGDNCTRSATPSTSYSCPSGWSQSGSSCSRSATPNTTYSCSPGDRMQSSGTPPQCVRVTYYPASYQSGYSGYYYCPSGGSLSGTTCYTSSSYTASYEPGTSGYYYCSRGGSLSGTTCTRTYSATPG